MKNLFKILGVVCLFASNLSFGQTVGINYQGAARNNLGEEISKTNISFRAVIREGSSSGTIIWQEDHSLTTDTFGLFNTIIGNGTKSGGTLASFSIINWGNAQFLEVQIDPNGGSNYSVIGVEEIHYSPKSLWSWSALNADSSAYSANAGWAGHADTAAFAMKTKPVDSVKHAIRADTAAFALNVTPVDSVLHAKSADTSGYSDQSSWALYADTANVADSAYWALQTPWANNAGHANFSDTANYTGLAKNADTAGYAFNSLHVDSSNYAHVAHNADTAGHAFTATIADTADHAINSQWAKNADSSNVAAQAHNATHAAKATIAGSANTATNADTAALADSAGYAWLSGNASHAKLADDADTAAYAIMAKHAEGAVRADTAAYSINALDAKNAVRSDTAGHANYAIDAADASRAINADTAKLADSAHYAAHALRADSTPHWVLQGSSITTAQSGGVGVGVTVPASRLDIGGSLGARVTVVNSESYNANDETVIIVNGTSHSGPASIQLPKAADVRNRIYYIKYIYGTYGLHVNANSGEGIDENPTYNLNDPNQFVQIVSDGANWWIIGESGGIGEGQF